MQMKKNKEGAEEEGQEKEEIKGEKKARRRG